MPPKSYGRTSRLSAAAAPKEVDGGWPRGYATPSGGAVTVFQPQIASWDGQRKMVHVRRRFIQCQGRSQARPWHREDRSRFDRRRCRSARELHASVKLTESNFPPLPNDQAAARSSPPSATSVPRGPWSSDLDRVLARLDKSQIVPKNVAGVKADPPAIFYSTSPSDPVVNLDWRRGLESDQGQRSQVRRQHELGPVRSHSRPRRSYLRYNDAWLEAADIKGPWKPAGKLPDAFGKLPADENWKDVKAALPGRPLTSSRDAERSSSARRRRN